MPKINLSTYIALAVLIGGLIFVVIPKHVQNNVRDSTQAVPSGNSNTDKNNNVNSNPKSNNTVSPSNGPQSASRQLVQVKTFDIVIKGGKIDGQNISSVLQGDTIRFRIIADEDGEFKINGLEKSVILEKDKQGVLFVTPQLVGRFPMVFKGSIKELGILEVFPKP